MKAKKELRNEESTNIVSEAVAGAALVVLQVDELEQQSDLLSDQM